jgi:molybdate transport system substrate-binding protein
VLLAMLPAAVAAASAARAQAVELHVAAAADLQPVMPALAAEYQRKTGVKVVTSFGSSATLAEQLQNGDPQDVFLSADFLHPETLIAAGLTDGKSRHPYARGVLVLWARRDSPAQPLTLDSLTKPSVQKIAVANDLHAPYGMAATRALKNLGFTDKVAASWWWARTSRRPRSLRSPATRRRGLISLTIASSQPFRDAGRLCASPDELSAGRQCGVCPEGREEPGGSACVSGLAYQQRGAAEPEEASGSIRQSRFSVELRVLSL